MEEVQLHRAALPRQRNVMRVTREQSAPGRVRSRCAMPPRLAPLRLPGTSSVLWPDAAIKRARIAEEARKITLHCMRHTAVSRLLQGGLNLQQAQHVLGHTYYSSTLIHAHLTVDAVAEKAVGILNPGELWSRRVRRAGSPRQRQMGRTRRPTTKQETTVYSIAAPFFLSAARVREGLIWAPPGSQGRCCVTSRRRAAVLYPACCAGLQACWP